MAAGATNETQEEGLTASAESRKLLRVPIPVTFEALRFLSSDCGKRTIEGIDDSGNT